DSRPVKGDPASIMRATAEPAAHAALVAAAVGLAVLPLALMGPVPGVELLFPFAVVVLGGLVTSTLIALLVWPALFLRFAAPRDAFAQATEGTELVAAMETL